MVAHRWCKPGMDGLGLKLLTSNADKPHELDSMLGFKLVARLRGVVHAVAISRANSALLSCWINLMLYIHPSHFVPCQQSVLPIQSCALQGRQTACALPLRACSPIFCTDITTNTNPGVSHQGIAKFEGHKGPVASLSFSENGYYLATAASDGVKVWDLRKLKNIRTLTPYETGQATAVSFDHSGLYLGVAGSDDARVYGTKQDWSLLNRFADLPAKVCVCVASPAVAWLYVHGCRWLETVTSCSVKAARSVYSDMRWCMSCHVATESVDAEHVACLRLIVRCT